MGGSGLPALLIAMEGAPNAPETAGGGELEKFGRDIRREIIATIALTLFSASVRQSVVQPWFTAILSNSLAESTPSLRRRLSRWVSTVRTLISS